MVRFDPHLEVSPFVLFRRLAEGRGPLLVDARAEPRDRTLAGAERLTGDDWAPPEGVEAVLFDDDGAEALPIVERLAAEGHRVKLLFGGLELYAFALDPEVVGRETYLIELAPPE